MSFTGLKPIFLFDTKRYFKSFMIFTITWVLLIFLFMTFFNGIKASADQLMQLYSTMPKELLQGLGKDPSAITSIYGYFGTAVMLYLFLSGCIFVIFMAVNSLAGEVANGNILFLLSKPVSRMNIYIAKVSALIVNILISNSILCVASILSVKLLTNETDVNWGFFVVIFIGLCLLELFFMALAEALGTWLQNGRSAAITSFIVILSYVLSVISGFSDKAQFLRYLSANYYISFQTIQDTKSLQLENLVIVILTIVLLVIAGYLFKREDIEV